MESCWKILKDHAAWKEVEMLNFYSKEKGSKKSKTFETTSWLAQGGFNLNDEACGSEEEIQEERPIGRDGAKKKASSSSSHFATYLLQEEELDLKDAARREEAELKREELALQRQTLELAVKKKRNKYIFYMSQIDETLPRISFSWYLLMSTSQDNTFPMNTLLHMIPIKLSSTNYLLWKNQMLPLLSYQKLTNHIDGTTAPSATITFGDQSIPNPAFTTWNDFDQRAVILLNSSLTEEAAAEVLGLTTAHAIWTALETAYSNSSVERIHSLCDSLRNLSKGTSTGSDYGRQFKGICDKLAAIGQPVDEMDKLHWFVCGLGASFETFFTAIRTTEPFTTFRDLLSQEESHEMFLKSLHGSATPPASFFSQQSDSRSSQGRQQRRQNYS
ncbi:putative RNA-directed DNA polymerase [Tanacetum coccineum]|uniref:RNA-directed DNA polymerase n=1 Tax=Tanacetum coccineum TaxID=301880 RepID=A0ABQ5B0L3_9ASTR